jgi:hypothetical protein
MMERTDAPGTIHLSAPTSSARNTSFGTPSHDSSTAAPHDDVRDGLPESALDLCAHCQCGLGTMRELNVLSCIDISAVHCSGSLFWKGNVPIM